MFTPQAEEVRAFIREVFELRSVDAGNGWLIFGLPPAELAAHPTDGEPRVELYLMCEDIDATISELDAKGVELTRPVADERFGRVTALRLPDGSELGLYQPSHPLPPRA